MADSLASFLVGKIDVFLREQTNLLTGVRREVEYLKNELQHMTAFLRVAESMAETDPQARVWIKQVRQVAFDIEDVIDEFTLRLAPSRRDFDPCGFISKIIQSTKKLKYRHQIASEIQRIKPRIANVSEGRKRYELIVPYPGSSSSITATNNMWDDLRGNALLQEEVDLVGITERKGKLIELLTESGPALKVISVVGMGGLGKTTLVKKVYDDVKNSFQNHAWISVSQSFNINELLKSIIHTLFQHSQQPTPEGMEKMSSVVLKNEIKKFLRESKYLIVLDDVWEVLHWENLEHAFPPNNCGSRIMLTTRYEQVGLASRMKFGGEVYRLMPLSKEEAWTLFCKRIFREHQCPSELETVGEEILERCEGLPLAIVAISGLLATRDNSMTEWDMVKRSLASELYGGRLRPVDKILSLSYHELPFYLKACMLYLCAFPEDYEIACKRLIRLWIAEGFVQEMDGSRTLEEIAQGYLNELLNRSLIQVAWVDTSKRIRTCCVHDILREVILSKAKDLEFLAIMSGDQRGTTVWLHEKAARRLSVHNFNDWKVVVDKDKRYLSKLHSLLSFVVEDFPSNTLFLGDLRLLTVLDLTGMKQLQKFPNGVVKLYHLRYLSLKFTNVRVVPSSIGKLQNLETLDLKFMNVESLPDTIVKLGRLRHLLMSSFKPIIGIGKLHSLQTIGRLMLKEDGAHDGIIQEIGRLHQLRRLHISNVRSEDGNNLCSTINNLINLRSLSVRTTIDDDMILDLEDVSSPPQYLQRLFLKGRLTKLPNWVSRLKNLTRLEIVDSELKELDDRTMQAFPNLIYLRFYNAFCGENLCFKLPGLQKLRVLTISGLGNLRRVDIEKGAMPNVEKIDIIGCELLEKVPFGIEHLAKLRRLRIFSVTDDLIKSIDGNEIGGGEDNWKLDHIPSVQLYGETKDYIRERY